MHKALLSKGLPCALKIYEGEQVCGAGHAPVLSRARARSCVRASALARSDRPLTRLLHPPCDLPLQHGFRKSENIEDSLNSELYFYSKIFGFTCAGDEIKPFKIDNLDDATAAAIDKDADGSLSKEEMKEFYGEKK